MNDRPELDQRFLPHIRSNELHAIYEAGITADRRHRACRRWLGCETMRLCILVIKISYTSNSDSIQHGSSGRFFAFTAGVGFDGRSRSHGVILL